MLRKSDGLVLRFVSFSLGATDAYSTEEHRVEAQTHSQIDILSASQDSLVDWYRRGGQPAKGQKMKHPTGIIKLLFFFVLLHYLVIPCH